MKQIRVTQPHKSLFPVITCEIQSVGSCPVTVHFPVHLTPVCQFFSSEISCSTLPSSPPSAGPGPTPSPPSQNSAHHTAYDKPLSKKQFQTYSTLQL